MKCGYYNSQVADRGSLGSEKVIIQGHSFLNLQNLWKQYLESEDLLHFYNEGSDKMLQLIQKNSEFYMHKYK